jgi:D-alanine-D-alanine ligase
MKRTSKIVVAMGGNSAEREISLLSGDCVMQALRSLGYDVAALDYDERFLEAVR